jgi:hypothetical protein
MPANLSYQNTVSVFNFHHAGDVIQSTDITVPCVMPFHGNGVDCTACLAALGCSQERGRMGFYLKVLFMGFMP